MIWLCSGFSSGATGSKGDYMEINITDDFDLNKIAQSGQCFRAHEFEDGTFRFVSRSNVLYIKKSAPCLYELSCNKTEWKNIWHSYFDFERNYQAIRDAIPKNDNYMASAANEGRGIRILKQDAWEMLITFIISQRKSIPSIKNSIELLCNAYGELVHTERETLKLFPAPEKLYRASESDLKNCKLGYRVGYIKDAARAICEQKLDLDVISQYDDTSLLEALKTVKGVGDKVANCICLFSYARTAMAPVDTWISKIIESKYKGVNPFPAYGDVAGIMQQYAFFYAQNHKDEF